VVEDGSLADGVDPESGEQVPAEGYRVPAAEDPVVVRASEVAVHPQGAVVAGGEAGAGEDVRRVDARRGEDEVGPDLLSVFQDGAAVHRHALSTQDHINPQISEVPAHDAAGGLRGRGQEIGGGLDERDLHPKPGVEHQPGQVGSDLAAGGPAPDV
jgi:hypothetical protein